MRTRNYDINNIGKTIKKLRLKEGLTQKELANKLWCTSQYVSMIESGKTHMSIETLDLCSKTFNVSIDYIVYGENFEKDSSVKECKRICLELLEGMRKQIDAVLEQL